MKLFTFSNPSPYPSLAPVYWANDATLHRLAGKETPVTREDMLRAAVQIASEAVAAKAPLIMLDEEAMSIRFADPAVSYSVLAGMADVIRAECGAAIPITSYVSDVLTLYAVGNRDVEITVATQCKGRDALIAALGKSFTESDPLMQRLDYIGVPAYLLGPASVVRDIDFMWADSTMLRALYPGKKLMYILWGVYHESFNPPNTVPAPDVLVQYSDVAKAAGDSICVFDPEIRRDDSFVGILA